ncbi:MAG: hypothetical protein JNK77_17515 [Saprospiraceae bacterium]|nr:hypothetical protein [Saprospiraceae bacterium]
MQRIAVVFLLICVCVSVQAQTPRSNVFLFDVRKASDTLYKLTKPRFLTAFNARGYNNQPAFFSNNELYITVQMYGDDQTDLYVLDLDKKTKTKVTETPDGEFSASRVPDYYSFSAIRQEINGRDTLLRLWQFPIDRLTNGKPVFKYLKDIGYYHWLDAQRVVVFGLDKGNYLAICDTRTDDVSPFATNVGRCFMRMPNGNLAYVQKSTSGDWLLMEKFLSRSGGESKKIINTLTGCEDFAVLPDGSFLMGRGSKLYKYDRYSDQDWEEIADLRYYGIKNITRLAVSNDFKLALVSD